MSILLLDMTGAPGALANLGFNKEFFKLMTHGGGVGLTVFGILGILSMASWGVIIFKILEVRKARKADEEYAVAFRKNRTLKEAKQSAEQYQDGTLSRIFLIGYEELARQNVKPTGEGGPPVARRVNVKGLERALRRAQRGEGKRLRRYLPILATAASVSPFVGLFGTVWGILNSFQQIGKMASASLAVVAPGIAEALIATAMGLAAAIPAAMAYNFFQARIGDLSTEMEIFILDLVTMVENISLRDGTSWE